MKKLNQIKPDLEKDGIKYYSEKTLKKISLENIKQILSNNKIKIKDIEPVGVTEDGKIQLKVPMEISQIGSVKVAGYVMWFLDLKEEKNGA